jgi:hypothetical protein
MAYAAMQRCAQWMMVKCTLRIAALAGDLQSFASSAVHSWRWSRGHMPQSGLQSFMKRNYAWVPTALHAAYTYHDINAVYTYTPCGHTMCSHRSTCQVHCTWHDALTVGCIHDVHVMKHNYTQMYCCSMYSGRMCTSCVSLQLTWADYGFKCSST